MLKTFFNKSYGHQIWTTWSQGYTNEINIDWKATEGIVIVRSHDFIKML